MKYLTLATFANSYGCKYMIEWNTGDGIGRMFARTKREAVAYAKSVHGKVIEVNR